MSNRRIFHSDRAPKAIGPYSQAVQAGNTVYLSGQTPLHPDTGELVVGDISAQARQVTPQQYLQYPVRGARQGEVAGLFGGRDAMFPVSVNRCYLFHGQTSLFGVMECSKDLVRDNPLSAQPGRRNSAGR